MQANDLQSLPYHSPPGTPRKLINDLKMLCEIGPGQTIFMLGRWLHPFCSHATYRVRVTAMQRAGNDCRRIHGLLVDFQERSVTSMALPDKQFFRLDLSTSASVVKERPGLSRQDIERIVRNQGISVGIYEGRGNFCVEAWKYSRHEGKKHLTRRGLGPLSQVEQMSEEDLASLVRSKFDMEVP